MLRMRWAGASALVLALALSPAAAQERPQPTGDAPAQAGPTPDTAAAGGEEETIVVTGFRRGLASSQSLKRGADQIVDAVLAQDIGKLPDINVSDSLARITGVQVDRANGEAGQVRIRGLPDFVTTYNGRDIFTAEARRVATQDFAAGAVAALEVYKSTTADQVEGGLAGLINVRSRRPFDFKGFEVAGAANGVLTSQAQKLDWNGNLLLSNRWDTGIGEIGALLNLSYTQLHYLDSARFDSGNIITRSAGDTAFRAPEGVGIFYSPGYRRRPSVNAAVQWQATPELEIYAEGLWQGFRRDVNDRSLFVPLFGDAQFSNPVLQPGTNLAQSLTVANAVRPDGFQAATEEKTDTYQYAAGAVWRGERLKLSLDVARTQSRFDLSVLSFDYAFARSPAFDIDFDVPRGPGGVEFRFVDFDTSDPANFIYRGFFDRALVAKGDDWQARFDIDYETEWSLLRRLQAGFRYVNRDGSFSNGERYSPAEGLRLPLSALPVDLRLIPAGFRGSDIQLNRQWVLPTPESIRAGAVELRQQSGFAPGTPPGNPLQAYEANEKSYAGYAQLHWGFDAPFPITGIVGIRGVRTENRLAGTSRVADANGETFVPSVSERGYWDWLPNASLRAEFVEGLQLRLSYTQTRTRPGFGDLNPSLIIDPPGGASFRTANGGNPNLRPVESNNYDASLEYYFGQTGLASVALFRRDINGFISPFQVTVQDPTYGELRIRQPINGTDGRLEGVEAQLSTFFDFDFVPEWARGFGVQANFTYTTGDQGLPPEVQSGGDTRIGFLNVSKYTWNIVGLYERGPISARVAYNRRSAFPTSFDNVTGAVTGEYTRAVDRLDLSFNVTPVENLTIALDIANLLGKPFRNYRQFDPVLSFPRDVRYEETVYSLGVRFRL